MRRLAIAALAIGALFGGIENHFTTVRAGTIPHASHTAFVTLGITRTGKIVDESTGRLVAPGMRLKGSTFARPRNFTPTYNNNAFEQYCQGSNCSQYQLQLTFWWTYDNHTAWSTNPFPISLSLSILNPQTYVQDDYNSMTGSGHETQTTWGPAITCTYTPCGQPGLNSRVTGGVNYTLLIANFGLVSPNNPHYLQLRVYGYYNGTYGLGSYTS